MPVLISDGLIVLTRDAYAAIVHSTVCACLDEPFRHAINTETTTA